ncbi:hypothetical protein OOC_02447 [Providencia rettgeri Dmel1]|nr:hypothetical protein OOC_02447 [Providencia rettgeri Dmel1]
MPLNYESDFFFLRIPLCWGWATWQDRWSLYEKNLDEVKHVGSEKIKYINFNHSHNFFIQAKKNVTKKINTWFIFWYLSSANHNKLTVFPKESQIQNIGHDGSGEHCYENNILNLKASPLDANFTPLVILEDAKILEAHIDFFSKNKVSFIQKLKLKLRRVINVFN